MIVSIIWAVVTLCAIGAAWDMVRRVAGTAHEKRLRAEHEALKAAFDELDTKAEFATLKREVSRLNTRLEGVKPRALTNWGK